MNEIKRRKDNLKRFNSKIHQIFWQLEINARLELFLDDHREELTEKDIGSFGELLYGMKAGGSEAPLIACGLVGLKGFQRESLADLFDAFKSEREELKQKLRRLKEKHRNVKRTPMSTLDIEGLYEKLEQERLVSDAMDAVVRELDAVPKRNSVPGDLFKYPSEKSLIDQKLIVDDGHPYPLLTEKAKNILENAYDVRALVNERIRQGESVPVAVVNQIHDRFKKQYSSGMAMKSIFKKVFKV